MLPSVICPPSEKTETTSNSKKRFSLSIIELLSLPGLAARLMPPMGVAFFGSIVNVGIVIYILGLQEQPTSDYGLVAASISVGLVLGSILMQGITQQKTQLGIGLSGIISGLAIISLFQPWCIAFTMAAGFFLGVGNGGQNVFTTSLLMKTIPKTKRTKLIPSFVFCVYFFVFASYLAGLFITQSNVIPLMICGGGITILLGMFSLTRKPTSP
ncbi:hypothetical protein [Corynebacterium anserum]|uniref:Major Facilitator Superfamily protein n=1 Tax=Corynebacterium anserum TaxID=2684406 RepID=A0A7G7YLV4_9CORY|nr:hypothetical protein [Corynebacterium anserum]QNH95474.1 hypothetical protein GP473_01050 [Corynebacterium anserum]